MKTANLTATKEAIKEWKAKGIERCNMEFQCGGDSMNDYTFTFFDKDEKELESDTLNAYFDEEVYKNVEFYVNSDGHYQGESGNVEINFEEDVDNEDGGYFSYAKSSESEWNESFNEVGYCELTEAEQQFVKDKIHSIVGGNDGEATNYKGDCILTDEEEELLASVVSKIEDYATSYSFENSEGEENDWFTYTTDMGEAEADTEIVGELDEANPTIIVDGKVGISINKSFTIYKSENE